VVCCEGAGGRAVGGAGPRSPRRQSAGAPHLPSRPPPARRRGARRIFALGRGAGPARRLAAGDLDVYEVDLQAGQYLDAVVEQKGIDVYVDVRDPAGRRLFRADTPIRAEGPEAVPLVAERTGRYRLEVGVGTGIPAGTYSARIAALRPATDRDRRRSRGYAAYYQARELDKLGSSRVLQQVAAAYEHAASQLHGLGERRREAEACYYLGHLYLEDNRPADARPLLERARELFTPRDGTFPALTLNELGRCYSDLGLRQPAEAAFDGALRWWRRHHDREGEAATLENLGILQQRHGLRWEALRSLQESLRLWQVSGDDAVGKADTLSGLGWVYASLGEWERAITIYEQLLAEASAAHDRRNAGVALTQLGNLHDLAGRPRTGLFYLQRALAALRGPGISHQKATVLNGLGVGFLRLGQLEQARAAYRDALDQYQRLGEKREEATAWANLGQVANAMRRPDDAMRAFARSQELAQQIGDPGDRLRALAGLAEAEEQRDNLAAAQERAERAVAEIESLRTLAARRDLQATWLSTFGRPYDLLIRVLMRRHRQLPGGGYDLEALARSEQRRERGLLDLLSPPPPGLDPALERERRQILADISRHTADEQNPVAGSEHVGAARNALAILFDRLSELNVRIRSGQGRAASPPQVVDTAAIDRLRKDLLDRETVFLEFHLDSPASYLWVLSADGVQSLELPARATLEPLIHAAYGRLAGGGDEEGVAFSSSRERPVVRDGEGTVGGEPAERVLGRVLLGPLAGALGTKRLLIAADGALRNFPFAALPEPGGTGDPLLVRHEIAAVPSLSVLAALRARAAARRPARRLAAIMADPVFDATDPRVPAGGLRRFDTPPLDAFLPRLRYTREEADEIARLAGERGFLEALDFTASRELVTSGALAEFRVLHFGTHGTLRRDRQEASALVLSRVDRAGRPIDGYLRVPDIEALDLPADLVVLSACDSAGAAGASEGIGLPEAFFSAGARSVLATLWPVDDKPSAALMRELYRHLLGDHPLAPAAALRAAQLSLRSRREWSAPRHWAGFVLSGDFPGALPQSRRPGV